MTVRVLVVDDSLFFRRRLTEMLNADSHIEVIESAGNGVEALRKVKELKPDVITMDIEMPLMDGISATKEIMQQHPTPILMFSSLTTEGARATLDALDAGALDFLPKKFDDISSDRETARRLLCARVRVLGARGLTKRVVTNSRKESSITAKKASQQVVNQKSQQQSDMNKFSLLAIGTSTGGPVALQQLLTEIPADFPLPILVIQHMPASFTPSFSERLNALCKVKVKQAVDNDPVTAGTVYIAPGGVQMRAIRKDGMLLLKIAEALPEQNYKPSVDITFSSLADFCSSDVLAMVLTGMGADGREGSRLLKAKGATVWAQDEASCVVYGMPMAVVEAGLADAILSLDEMVLSLKGDGG